MESFAEMTFGILSHLDTSPIGEFGELVGKAVRSQAMAEDKRLNQSLASDPDNPWHQEWHDLRVDQLGQVKELGTAVQMMALYQAFEVALKSCLDEIFVEWPNETEAQSKARKKDVASRRGSLFKRAKSVEPALETLPGFNAINELRLLANAWKHKGMVTEELAKDFPLWKKHRPLDKLEEHYPRLKAGVKQFCEELGPRLKDHWRYLQATMG